MSSFYPRESQENIKNFNTLLPQTRQVQFLLFVDANAKLRKVIISLALLVRPSVWPHRTTRLPLEELSWKLKFEDFFQKSVEKIRVSLNFDKNNEYFTWTPKDIYDISVSSVPRGWFGGFKPPHPPKFRRYRWSPPSHEQEEPASRFPFVVHCVLIRL